MISETLRQEVQAQKESNAKPFAVAITVGVSLCILSVVPLLIAGALGSSDQVSSLLTSTLFLFIASGVFLFVRFGMIKGSYSKLLQEEEYAVDKKRMEARTSVFSGVYWCLTTALYLGLSFWTMAWDKTWIIWPVAGVLFAALYQIVEAIIKRKK